MVSGGVGKNISWLAASASRAGIHKSFLVEENLADITAKAGSQSTASSLVGTGVGIALSALVGPSVPHVVVGFVVLSVVHLYCNYRSLTAVNLRTLNPQRTELLCLSYLNSCGKGEPSSSSDSLPTEFSSLTASVASPEDIGALERFVFPFISPTQRDTQTQLMFGASVRDLTSSPEDLQQLQELFHDEGFLASYNTQHKTVVVLLLHDAKATDVLCAYFYATRLRYALSEAQDARQTTDDASNTSFTVLKDALNWYQSQKTGFLSSVQATGWTCSHVFLDAGLRVEFADAEDDDSDKKKYSA